MGVGVVAYVCEGLYSAWTYKCFRWKLLMESGPVAGEFLMLLMTCLVFCGENAVNVWSIELKSLRRIMRLSECKGFM